MNKKIIPLALAAMDEKTPIEGRTRLQKMVFMLQQELKESSNISEDQLYEFFAYDYGPFSKELAEEIDDLIEKGLIVEHPDEFDDGEKVKYLYEIKSQGVRAIQNHRGDEHASDVIEAAREMKQRFNETPLPDVIDEVYSEYPEYAEESVY